MAKKNTSKKKATKDSGKVLGTATRPFLTAALG
jgi:hypothetical protein